MQPEYGAYHPYDIPAAAKYIARMIAINRGMDISSGTDLTSTERPVEGAVIRNMAYVLDEVDAADFPVLTESEAELVRYYTFTDSDENSYLALWNDIAAAVDCTPVECDITLSELSADRVTALDPFNSIEQELVFENSEDGLSLKGIMLTDYPIIIRIQ